MSERTASRIVSIREFQIEHPVTVMHETPNLAQLQRRGHSRRGEHDCVVLAVFSACVYTSGFESRQCLLRKRRAKPFFIEQGSLRRHNPVLDSYPYLRSTKLLLLALSSFWPSARICAACEAVPLFGTTDGATARLATLRPALLFSRYWEDGPVNSIVEVMLLVAQR